MGAVRRKPELFTDIRNHVLGHRGRRGHHRNPARDAAQKDMEIRKFGSKIVVSPFAYAVRLVNDKGDDICSEEVAGEDGAVEFRGDSHFGTNERDAVFILSYILQKG